MLAGPKIWPTYGGGEERPILFTHRKGGTKKTICVWGIVSSNPGWVERRNGWPQTLKNSDFLLFGDYRSKAVVPVKFPGKVLKILLQMTSVGSLGKEPLVKNTYDGQEIKLEPASVLEGSLHSVMVGKAEVRCTPSVSVSSMRAGTIWSLACYQS